MTPHEFISKWRNGGDERRDWQSFFDDLCRLVGHPTPREADPEHTWFTYEYGASKASGGEGWADAWKKGFFGWEAKGTGKDLDRAYSQLKMYADALQNPPLLVCTDLQTIVVHTNFTNTVKQEIRLTVDELADHEKRKILEAVFRNPQALRPGITREAITQEAAEKFATLAKALRERGNAPQAVAHFLNRLIFCMFAEDIGLLPNYLFTKMVDSSQTDPTLFEKRSADLFAAMSTGGDVAFENIDWFNGGLFEDGATLRLEPGELKVLRDACRLDWSEIDPTIFGTLFERGLDPAKRSQLGAHYTDPDTIMKIIRPVVIEPWLREWEVERDALAQIIDKSKAKTIPKKARDRFAAFLDRLRAFTVLDPACGSGNFLYLSLRALKDIEHRILIEGEALGLGRQFPTVGPASVKGIELNTYAAELARITIWIGEIQWMIQNGYGAKKQPILHPLDQIERRDALLNPDGTEAAWPLADVAIGNPPFIGDKKIVSELGEAYADTLRRTYVGRVPGGADFVCYWFEKANDAIKSGNMQRAGLVATNSIRGGKNREVLKHITKTGRIFEAWSDEDWINDGAAVRVSLICFGKSEHFATLDSKPVHEIFPDLTATVGGVGVDLTRAKRLPANRLRSFQGSVKVGPFDVSGEVARRWLLEPNALGRPNSEVLRPLFNAKDLTSRPRGVWIIDFSDMPVRQAAAYELPFAHVEEHVKPVRAENRDASRRERWWLHGRVGTDIRAAVEGLARVIVTPRVAKHRFFVWADPRGYYDDATVTIARDDGTAFGILHSRMHEIWSLRLGTYLGVGNDPRYTPTSCFETFPFPEGLTLDIDADDYNNDPRAIRIAEAARALVEARDQWLNPQEWTERVPEVVSGYPDRIYAKPGHEADLKKRTLTNLYNARPAWLDNLHRDLDEAVAAAYGWPWPLSDDEILRRLFELNQLRGK